jgi:hypothetical protein
MLFQVAKSIHVNRRSLSYNCQGGNDVLRCNIRKASLCGTGYMLAHLKKPLRDLAHLAAIRFQTYRLLLPTTTQTLIVFSAFQIFRSGIGVNHPPRSVGLIVFR